MKDICDLQSEMFVERMSSAWAKAPKLRPEMEGAQVLLFSSRRMGSITSRKRVGERTHPCRTPRQAVKEGETWRQTLTGSNVTLAAHARRG